MKNVLEWLENKTEQEKKRIAFIDPKDEISFKESIFACFSLSSNVKFEIRSIAFLATDESVTKSLKVLIILNPSTIFCESLDDV